MQTGLSASPSLVTSAGQLWDLRIDALWAYEIKIEMLALSPWVADTGKLPLENDSMDKIEIND